MATATTSDSIAREPRLLGQTVVVVGGSAGIGLETARLARAEGADVVLTGRDPKRLEQAARDLSAKSSAAFDADDDAAGVKRFFDALPAPIDHVLVAAYIAPVLRAHARKLLRGGGRRRRPARHAGPRGCAPRGTEDAGRRHAAAHRRRRKADRSRVRHHCRRVLGAATVHRGACAGARASTRQPHPSRLRRHRAGRAGTSRTRRQSKPGARSFAPRCRSGASSDRPTSPHSPSTS